jgi:hypothetical protein
MRGQGAKRRAGIHAALTLRMADREAPHHGPTAGRPALRVTRPGQDARRVLREIPRRDAPTRAALPLQAADREVHHPGPTPGRWALPPDPTAGREAAGRRVMRAARRQRPARLDRPVLRAVRPLVQTTWLAGIRGLPRRTADREAHHPGPTEGRGVLHPDRMEGREALRPGPTPDLRALPPGPTAGRGTVGRRATRAAHPRRPAQPARKAVRPARLARKAVRPARLAHGADRRRTGGTSARKGVLPKNHGTSRRPVG